MAGPANFPRLDCPRPGVRGSRCFVCHETTHFLGQCEILPQYIANGKMGQDSNNLIMLGNGDCLPQDPLNRAWKVWVDEFYANNPHLLPSPVQSGHHDPPPHPKTTLLPILWRLLDWNRL